MSLNIIPEVDIKALSKTLIDIIKEEEKVSLKDMKMYLNKTNLSAEQKLKEYSFSSSLLMQKLRQDCKLHNNILSKIKKGSTKSSK